MENIKANMTLDTSGKCCPMPMVEANRAIKGLAIGDVLEIVATDIATRTDIPSWCNRLGYTLLSLTEQDDSFRYYVRKDS